MQHNKTVWRRIAAAGIAAALAFITLGCPQDGNPPTGAEWRITVNGGKDCAVYIPTSSEFDSAQEFTAPESVSIKIRNTGGQPTGALQVRIAGRDREIFFVSPSSIADLAPGEETEVQVEFSPSNPRKPVTYEANLLAGKPGMVAGKAALRYTVFALVPGALTVDKPLLQLSDTATVTLPNAADKKWFSSRREVASAQSSGTDSAALTTNAAGRTVIGVIEDDTDGRLTVTGGWIRVYPQNIGPQLQSAAINGSSPADANKLVITYDKAPVIKDTAAAVKGFSIGNAAAGAMTFSNPQISAGAKTLTLTANRQPSRNEIDANSLTLIYDDTVEYIFDDAEGIGISGVVPIDISGFENYREPVNVTRSYASVTASNFHSATYQASNAVDGNTATRWATNSSANKQATLELTYSPAITVTKAVIYDFGNTNPTGRIKSFKIEYDAGGGWTEAYTYTGAEIPGSNNGSQKYEVSFGAVSSTKFRLNILDAASVDPSVWEFELWGYN